MKMSARQLYSSQILPLLFFISGTLTALGNSSTFNTDSCSSVLQSSFILCPHLRSSTCQRAFYGNQVSCQADYWRCQGQMGLQCSTSIHAPQKDGRLPISSLYYCTLFYKPLHCCSIKSMKVYVVIRSVILIHKN